MSKWTPWKYPNLDIASYAIQVVLADNNLHLSFFVKFPALIQNVLYFILFFCDVFVIKKKKIYITCWKNIPEEMKPLKVYPRKNSPEKISA